ncbi:hypothetical protein E2C01_038791 [Portunus trituberculatus]|uniref:Uncharacterized protein n=1 Tax=Portunus trituberculatus TaxID=210409 RepID=A0A5B7FI33_PORTR|nr:hypothetical protein [Portunus trituberculatus]
MFMGVHGLQNSRGRIGNLMKQMKAGNLLPKPDQRGKHSNRPNKYSEQSLQAARRHIEMYINRNMTLKKMFRDFYVPWCEEHKIVPVRTYLQALSFLLTLLVCRKKSNHSFSIVTGGRHHGN